jgi:LacI family transcriptional regulator, galactose operon repressor
MKKHPTIRDVARHANVSPATVSCVINERKNYNFAEATIAKINEAVEELGYSPNKMIRSLQTGKANAIGIGYFRVEFNHTFIDSMLDKLSEIGNYDVTFYLSKKGKERNPKDYLDGRVDGIIFNESRFQRVSEYLGQIKFPTVVMLKRDVSPGVACSNADYFEIARKAIDYLCSMGHRNVAFLAANVEEWEDSYKTLKGYEAGMEDNDLGIIPGWIYTRNSSGDEKCNEALCRWMSMPKKIRPTVVFSDNNIGAAGLFKAAEINGIKIPENLSICSSGNNYDEYSNLIPKLTSFYVSREDIGKYAVESLIKIIEGGSPEDFRKPITYKLIKGGSVKKI